MEKNLPEINEPLNSNERYLYAIAYQQKILIEQMNSIIEYIAKKESVAVTITTHEEKQGVSFEKEEAKVEPKPAPKKRAPRKKKEVVEAEVK